MLFVNIPDLRSFFQKIGQCHGEVDYIDARGALRDLKPLAAQLQNADFLFDRGVASLEVIAREKDDRERLLRFMMEARRA